MEGAIVFVTGAGSGLGAAIARRFAADGARVVVNDVSEKAAEAVAGEIGGDPAVFDVTDSAAFDAAVDDVVARHGRLDVMVNNAGGILDRPDVMERAFAAQMAAMEGKRPDPVRAFSTLSDADFDRLMRIHVYGTFYGTRAALRHMEEARSGAVVNLCSIYSSVGSSVQPEYAAAKHAIAGLTRSAGVEVAPLGIRVNAVAPGFIDTRLLDPVEAAKPFIRAQIPAARFGTADEVAEMVRFLGGPEASYCFGEILGLTGGWVA